MKNLQDFAVQDYLRIARRRIWYLIVPTLLVSIGVGIYVWRMPSIYKSETTILVSDRLVPEDYIGSLVKQSVMDRIEFARQQLRSRTFVERIAQEFQLGAGLENTDLVVNTVINNTEITTAPPNQFKIAFYSSDPGTAQAVTRRLAERVMQTNTTFRQEKVTGADQFLDEQLRQAAGDLAQAEQKLADFNQKNFPGVPQQGANVETLSSLQAELTTAESDLKAALDQRTAYERTLAEHKDVKIATTAAAPQPVSKKSAAPVRPAPSPLELELNKKREELAGLLTRYKPEYPDVVRLAREVRELAAQVAQRAPAESSAAAAPATPEVKPEEKALPEIDVSVDFYEAEVRSELAQLNRQIVKLEANKKELANKVATYSRRMNMPPNVMQELASLNQDQDSARQRYTYLSTRKLNSDLAGKVDTDANNKTFTTVDPPNLPQAPVRPDRLTLTGMGCIAGLMLGIGLAFGRDIMDPTLSDESSVVSELKLPVLTSIPVVGSTKSGELKQTKKRKKEAFNPRLVPLEQPADEPVAEFSIQASDTNIREVISGRSTIATEQFQMMRAELGALRQRGVKSLVITSAVPDEGKTFISCCLAGMLAKEQDRKVLLIDGDLRTGSAGHALKVDNGVRRYGLSDVLRAEVSVENCIIPCLDLNLWVLPAGRAVDNPVELLSSPRLHQMMMEVTILFDWIIVDSPPVLPIADTSVLSPVCDASLIVVRADRTPSSLTKQTIAKLGRERVPGIVLNGVRDLEAKQYYGRYYHQLGQAQK